MNLNKTLAVALHRAMWTDMQTELGNNPSVVYRTKFKEAWIKEHFPDEHVMHSCFLCEYALRINHSCSACPIVWPEGHCAGFNFSHGTAPISDILALPERIEKRANLPDDCKKYVANDEKAVEDSYYRAIKEHLDKTDETLKRYGDELKAPIFLALSEASGLLASNESVRAHISKIKACANQEGRIDKCKNIFETLSAYSGVSKDVWNIHDHVKAIQKKAVEEYFAKTPGAKLASMDVDEAFKQYADEQMEPIFKQLSKASGLSENNHFVRDHINWIKLKGEQDIRNALKEEKTSIFKELAKESGLDVAATVEAHINAIYDNGFDDGRDYEKDRIIDKIGEMLNDKPTGKIANT